MEASEHVLPNSDPLSGQGVFEITPPAIPASESAKTATRGTYAMADLLQLAKHEGASDLHLRVGVAPAFRIHGTLTRIEGPKLDREDMDALLHSVASEPITVRLKEHGSADFAISLADGERFRVHICHERGNVAMVLRNIPTKIRSLETLGVPPSVADLLSLSRGLVLVVGPTGSGKTTTLASMIDTINASRNDAHIITLEDPIEYYHGNKEAIITQREVRNDVPSFADGVRDALRANPDVILVGEMRDQETMEAALHAAETGHLVFATLHTTGAAKTVDRIIGAFPKEQQDNIRTQLSTVLQGVISQLLIPRHDEPGRAAIFEVMISNPAISNCIRENKLQGIADAIQTGRKVGMVTLDDSLVNAYAAGKISRDEAYRRAQVRATVLEAIEKVDREAMRATSSGH